MPFEQNVFINCPFDESYLSLLRPLLFTVIYFRLTPRIALERTASSEQRLHKIFDLIAESKYGIHDLSRLKAAKEGEYYRLNMPLELGIDVGCKQFGSDLQRSKCYLVLASDSYQYRAAASDLSGADIEAHNDKPEEIIATVRKWLVNQTGKRMSGSSKIWGDFLGFMAQNYKELTARGFSKKDIESHAISELINDMEQWAVANLAK